MDLNDPNVDLEGQGHRSKVKATRLKNVISGLIFQSYRSCVPSQGSNGLRSEVTGVNRSEVK